MTEVETALLGTDPFRWSHANAALSVEPAAHDPDTITILAGVPDGDWDHLLEQWLTAVLMALPSANIEDAEIVDADLGEAAPEQAARITLSLPDDVRWGDPDADPSP